MALPGRTAGPKRRSISCRAQAIASSDTLTVSVRGYVVWPVSNSCCVASVASFTESPSALQATWSQLLASNGGVRPLLAHFGLDGHDPSGGGQRHGSCFRLGLE